MAQNVGLRIVDLKFGLPSIVDLVNTMKECSDEEGL